MEPVAICAETTAGWHASWLRALGLRSERRDGVWRALDPPPFIYWTAITLTPDPPSRAVLDVYGALCDSWSSFDLEPLGFEEGSHEPWFVRHAGDALSEEAPAELEVVRVSTVAEVAEFEQVSLRGFGVDGPSIEAGSIHPGSILADARITMLTGRVGGNAIAAAMSYRGADVVGIYGVTTIASARGRGYATALTRALIDPAVHTVLSPSPEAERLYRRLGFEQVGELRVWHRVRPDR